MSASTGVAAPPSAAGGPNPTALVEQSRAFAARLTAAVAAPYLEFRRVYYHEERPSLATPPPAHAEVRRAEVALLAERLLQLLPRAVRSLPIVGGLLDHLQHVADLHSISERERTSLHNMTIAFLHGIDGGIQPWYVEWLLATAHNLGRVTDPDYYLEFPWDAVLYHTPGELAAFDAAVRRGDVPAIERVIERLARRLVAALHDPMGAQSEFAFTGPDGEQRRRLFNLRTAAALALGAYLIAWQVRALVRPRGSAQAPRSALAPLPPQLVAQAVDGEQAPR